MGLLHFRDLPIKWKFTLITTLTSSLTLLLAGAAYVTYDLVTFRQAMTADLLTLAQIIGDNSSAALTFDDQSSAKEILKSLTAKPHILSACIFRKNGQVFAKYERVSLTKDSSSPVPRDGCLESKEPHLVVSQPIVFDQEITGSISIESDLQEFYSRLRRYIAIGAVVFVASSLVGFLLSLKLQHVISAPILHLAETAKAVSDKKDYSVRAVKQSRDELGLLIDGFNEMLAQIQKRDAALEVANRHKSEFLANMSHELRTPLNAVIGFSEVLLEKMFGDLNAKQQEYLRDIHSSGRHLLSLINDVLDLSKVEAGRMELELSTFPLRLVVEKALTLVRERCLSHGIKLNSEVDERLDYVTADERKLKQILLNLLSNAVKFTPPGGTVRLVAVRKEDVVEILVRDTGVGIAPEDRQKIFEEFRQVGADAVGKHEGTGLGLALAKKFVELHGGAIWVESQVGAGSTFMFTLPMRPPVEEGIATLAATLPAPSRRPLVLIVEDDRPSANLLRIYLEEEGFSVEVAHDAEAGFDKASRLRPAIVTLDILLPEVDGWDLLERMKSTPATMHIPVVIVSMLDERGKGFALGAAEYLVKPVDRLELVRAIRHVCPVSPTTRKVIVLAVDDDPMVLEIIEVVLTVEGFDVLKAAGGREGLELARERHPDIIVLDLLMPDLDGFQVVDELKLDQRTKNIPIVILTARTLSREDKQRLNGRVSRMTQKADFDRTHFARLLHALAETEAG